MDIETRGTDRVVCPYCGNEHETDNDYAPEANEFECGVCDRTFVFEPEYSVSFNSWPLDEHLANEVRTWESTIQYLTEQGRDPKAVKVYAGYLDKARARLAALSAAETT
jgi:soluble lytic murein transglycosylase-like protein